MSEDKTGGPAFPSELTAWAPDKTYLEGEKVPCYGMTLLDYFAGRALKEFLVSYYCEGSDRISKKKFYAEMAEQAYDCAAAMLEERKKWVK